MSFRVTVGKGSCGIAAGAGKLSDALAPLLEGTGIPLGTVGCIGMCWLEPIVDINENGLLKARLVQVQPEQAPMIAQAVKTGDFSVIEPLRITKEDSAFLTQQTRIALRNCGIIDPESIDSALESGGYQALGKILSGGMSPEEVIECIKVSGLAGRGSAGYPTWSKWNAARQFAGEEKRLICNADEGDPGAFTDRAVIESDPHTLIEGMLIGAYAIGAQEAIVYVRAEYPLAIRRLEHAIREARQKGYIGSHIMGSSFSCEFRIRADAGALVCEESTPYKQDQSPNIGNAETFANVAWIINNGGEAFAAIGTEDSKGTKVFALTGKIRRGGLVEIPMGMTLRQVIFDIGGGIRDGGTFKAVQMGGPSGGCIPESLLDTVIDCKTLAAAGAVMGSGSMVVMDDSTCMVGMAKYFLDFTAKETCGKCVRCRIGTKHMQEILTRIVSGEGREGDIALLEELCNAVRDSALCVLGQTAPNPVRSTLRYFRDEFEAHIAEKRCPAHTCTGLLHYRIRPEKCRGCTACARNCPVYAISGVVKGPHEIDPSSCIRCGQCMASCKFGAVTVD
ncbi:MAG: 4Fe-4S binding protein [Oscillospiraceae bacterium]|nr:4Fe-4S binding protein [Oscillospiraceae bacterium]